jgi:hypothetical protein
MKNQITTTMLRGALIQDVLEERDRQDAKFGEQNHPALGAEGGGVDFIPSATFFRNMCAQDIRRGEVNWVTILLEEVAELIEACAKGDKAERDAERVQCMAVLMAWAESDFRNNR